ncbi:MAG: porin family protein [Acidobacteriia bacterium]|nr:porin family protein [Terriglobia bacterium]
MRTLCLLLFGAASALAQPVTFGVRAGVPLTDFFTGVQNQNFTFATNPRKYVIGPSIELRLPFGLGVELDALHRSVEYAGSVGATVANASASSWEFPLLAKYRFPTKVVRPFVDAGFAFDTLTGLKQSVATATGLSNSTSGSQNTKGFVLGAGLDIHLLLHFSPEIRYTHWGSSHFVDPVNMVRGSQNQAEFLLGVTF